MELKYNGAVKFSLTSISKSQAVYTVHKIKNVPVYRKFDILTNSHRVS